MSGRERYSEFAGSGCLVQGFGLFVMPVGGFLLAGLLGAVAGAIIGLPVLIVGGRMAHKWRCTHCKNKLESKSVRVCAACHEELD